MPIDTQGALLKLNPLTPLTGMGGSDQLDMERQRLELMRQQFEETKRQNQKDDEYRKLSQEAAMRREQIISEREKQQAAAQAAAKNLEARQAALAEVGKQYQARDFGAMAAAAEQLNQLGGYAKRLDTGGPFPAYQLALEPPKVPAGLNPMDALGYDKLGTPDSLPETEQGAAPELSTEEAFRQAGSVPAAEAPAPTGGDPTTDTPDELSSENPAPGELGPPTAAQAQQPAQAPSAAIQGLTPGMTGFAPRRPGDEEDLTGGVTTDAPSDVLNTAALQYEQKRRLGPVMASMAAAYPESYRDSVGKAGNAMLEAGMAPEKTMQLAQAARQEVGGAVEKEQAHEFKMQEEAAKAGAPLKRTEEQDIAQKGFTRARSTAKDKKIPEALGTFAVADEIEQMLSGQHPLGEERAINLLGQLNAQSKQQSDKDADRLTGMDRASLTTKINQYIYQITNSGFDDPVRNSMLDFVQTIREHSKAAVHDWMESTVKEADSNKEPLVGRGMREYMNGLVGPDLLREYDKEAGDTQEPAAQGGAPQGGGQGDALEGTAGAAGLNTGAIRRVVGGESNGDPQAASKNSSAKGLWQALDATAQRYTNPRTGEKFADSAELAKLAPAEQYQVLTQYLKDSGVTKDSPPDDYALAIAAPAFVGKGADKAAVVYPKGSEKWKANAPWRPADGGDITVGSIIDYYFGNKKAAGADKPKGKSSDDAEALEGL